MVFKQKSFLFIFVGLIILLALFSNMKITGEQTRGVIETEKEFRIFPTQVYFVEDGRSVMELYNVDKDGDILLKINSEFVEIKPLKEINAGSIKIKNLKSNYNEDIEKSWAIVKVSLNDNMSPILDFFLSLFESKR